MPSVFSRFWQAPGSEPRQAPREGHVAINKHEQGRQWIQHRRVGERRQRLFAGPFWRLSSRAGDVLSA
eukprot:2710758-Lingulodinium_polyedra.AAC.1